MDKKEVPMDGYTGKDIDIADLVDTAHIASLEQLKTEIEDYQELLIQDMLNRGYRKAGSYMKTIVTTLGTITFRVVRLRKPGSGTTSPLPFTSGTRSIQGISGCSALTWLQGCLTVMHQKK